MSVLELIASLFSSSYKVVKLHEDFEKVTYILKASGYKEITVESLISVLGNISGRDLFHLSVSYLKPIVLKDLSEVKEFVDRVNEEFSDEEDIDDVPFDIELNIYKKKVDNTISIYSIKKIIDRFKIENFQNVLKSFSKIISDYSFPHFNLITDERVFCTQTIYFYHQTYKDKISVKNIKRDKIINKRLTNCNFLDEKDYGFIPEDFDWQIHPTEEEFKKLFKLLKYIFSVVSLSNISSLKNNCLEVSFEGYKKLNENINCQEIFDGDHDLDVLIETYQKCYAGGEISDKIGIVRNLLPINVENSILQVKPEFNVSIDSNYKIYLKENVARYIEIKQGIVQNLTDAIQKSNAISNSFYEDLKKNLFAFLTFFVTILIFNTTNSGKLENIFTRDIATIAYVLLFISLLFLYLSYNITRRRRTRFCDNYESLKARYKDLLDQNDIDNIFNSDEEHEKNKLQINRGIKEATIIWISSVVILFSMVLFLQVSKNGNKKKNNSSKNVNITVISTKKELTQVQKDIKKEIKLEPKQVNEESKVEVVNSTVTSKKDSKSEELIIYSDSTSNVNYSILK